MPSYRNSYFVTSGDAAVETIVTDLQIWTSNFKIFFNVYIANVLINELLVILNYRFSFMIF